MPTRLRNLNQLIALHAMAVAMVCALGNATPAAAQELRSAPAGVVPAHTPMAADSPPVAAAEQIELPYYQQQCQRETCWPKPEPIWQPLLHWKQRVMRHSHPNDPARHIGLGVPLSGTSWRNRPLYAGWLVGGLWGDQLTDDLNQDDALFGGYRLGYDFDHYWGSELRFAWTNVELLGDSPLQSSDVGHLYTDASLLYYPWGDAHWRPFAGIGLGLARFRFDDQLGVQQEEHSIHMPLQIGVKYLLRKWLSVRCELTDNLVLGGDELNLMNNFSATLSVEWRFGGRRRSYFPWSTTTALW